MRLLVISDVHGNLPALEAVLDAAKGVDGTICTGDLAGYFPYVNEVIEIISSLNNCICVMGNHDYVLLNSDESTGSKSADLAINIQRRLISDSNRAFLRSLPDKRASTINGRQCFVFHGSPANPLTGREPFWQSEIDEGLYCFGHSHSPLVQRIGGSLIINPGSCGFPRDSNPRSSYAVLDTATWSVSLSRVEYSVEAVAQKCAAIGLPEVFSRSLAAGRWLSNPDVRVTRELETR